jgi:hypothetical protein
MGIVAGLPVANIGDRTGGRRTDLAVRLGVVKGEQYPSCIPETPDGLNTRSIALHPYLDPDFTGVNQLI